MEHLPPSGWADIVRRSDLDHLSAATATEFAAVRQEMASEFKAVRNEMATEFAAIRNEMALEFAAIRNEMALEFAAIRNEMALEFAKVRGEMQSMKDEIIIYIEKRLNSQNRWLVGMMSANLLTMLGIVLAVVQKL